MKKVWKYIIITLLLLLGLCCVGVLYLFFIPNSNLFNITYINNSKELVSAKYEMTNVNTIALISRSYDVNVCSTEEKTIYVEAESRSFGFVLEKNKTFAITESLNDGMLTIHIQEPHGFATNFNSSVNLYIPASKIFNLNLSNYKANTTIKNENIKINNLTYSTTNGDFNFVKGSISGNLKLTLNKSIFKISENVEISKTNDVTLSLTTGKFYAEHSVLGDVTINSNVRGVIKINECETLTENIVSAGGSINITKISQINVKTSDTNIYIHEITDGALIKLTGSGSVSIGVVNGQSSIETNSGSTTINVVNSIIMIESNTGNITVWTAKMKTSVKTNYGDVQIYFDESDKAVSYKDNSDARVLIANITNGKLNATGVENVDVKISNNGRLFLKMINVYGSNKIEGSNGEINIVVNKSSSYILTTKTNTGNVKVNLAQIPEYGGYTTQSERVTNVNCEFSSNALNASTTNGNLKILDTNFA